MPYRSTLTREANPGQIRDTLMEAGQYLAGLRAMTAEERAGATNYQDDVRSAVEFIHEWDPILTALERGAAPARPESVGPVAATMLNNPGYRSAGTILTEHDGYTTFAQSHRSAATFEEFEIPGSLFGNNNLWRTGEQFRTTLDGVTSGAGPVWLPLGSPYEHPPVVRQMRLFLRDVLNVQETGLASVPYIQERSPQLYEFGASAVDSAVQKPEVTMLWDQADAPVRKIAAWIPATQEIIEDAPTIRGYVDTRLGYMLAIREEYEILNGSGTAPHLKGILQQTGLQTQSGGADKITALGTAIGKIEIVDGDADGIAMYPTDYWTMITTRNANQFDGGFSTGLPYGSVPNGVWGLPVVRSRAIASGTAIVGAWRMGATLFDRMQTTIKVGNQHNDFFTTNKIAILAEERVALAVHRPDFFVNVTLP